MNSDEIKIYNLFSVVKNEDRKQYEFTPKVNGFTSYTVNFSEVQSEEDACIAVWKSIKAEMLRGANRLLQAFSPVNIVTS